MPPLLNLILLPDHLRSNLLGLIIAGLWVITVFIDLINFLGFFYLGPVVQCALVCVQVLFRWAQYKSQVSALDYQEK